MIAPRTAALVVCLCVSLVPAVVGAQQRSIGGQTMISHVGQVVVADVGPLGKRYSVYRYEGVLVSGDMPVTEYRRAMASATPLLAAGERIFEVTGTSAIQPVPGAPADIEVRTCSSCEFLTGSPDAGAGRVFRYRRAADGLTLVGSYSWGP